MSGVGRFLVGFLLVLLGALAMGSALLALWATP